MTVRLILGNQLNYDHPWYAEVDEEVVFVLMETRDMFEPVVQHIQIITAELLAMRNFANYLGYNDHKVIYVAFDQEENKHSLTENLQWILDGIEPDKFEYLLPEDIKTDRSLKEFCRSLDLESEAIEPRNYFTGRFGVKDFLKENPQMGMEEFYIHLRKKFGILMNEDSSPRGGRFTFSGSELLLSIKREEVPEPMPFYRDVSEIVNMVKKSNLPHFGEIDIADFLWPLSRQEFVLLLNQFAKEALQCFGVGFLNPVSQSRWNQFMNHFYFAMNHQMVHPVEIIQRVLIENHLRPEEITIARSEAFIRQFLGWREYLRGVKWNFADQFEGVNIAYNPVLI